MNLKKNLYYTHRKGILTVKEIIEDKSLIFYNKDNPVGTIEFLNFTSDSGITNEQAIKSAYVTNDEKKEMGFGADLKIKPNTQLVIPKSRATKTEIYPQLTIPKNQYQDTLFKSKVLSQLQNNKGYRIVHPQVKGTTGSQLAKKIPKISVWLWSRVLGQDNNEDGWFDLTPFIQGLSTNVTSNGGNFNFNLPPITCSYKDGRWILKKEQLKFYTEKNGEIHYLSQSSFFSEETREINTPQVVIEGVKQKKRTKFLFQNIISPNDLVFIKFDTLELESDYRVYDSNFQVVNSSMLPGKVYDMIGLVDRSTMKTTVSRSKIEVSIDINGRDLIKPLIDNGIYFFPSEYANKGYKDLYFSDGSIAQLSVPYFRNIEQIITFFLTNDRLNSIRVVPEGLLSSFGTDGKGIWKIINLSVDKSVLNRFVVDSSLSVATGSMLTHFRKICQEPFVEFFTDTYFDQFHLVIRTPPFTRTHLKNVLNGSVTNEDGSTEILETSYITIDEGQLLYESLSFSDNNVHTWFQVTPKEVVGGISQDVWTSVFPPKVFPELVEIFGSKPLQVTSNYLAYTLDLENEKLSIAKSTQEQALKDLIYIIESHVHLPFTREGTLKLIGDRRLKRGEYIYYIPTNELFYIESVAHSYNSGGEIENITTLQVSRGMVIDYILGKDGISYFDIVDLTGEKVYIEYEEEITKSSIEKRTVKEKVVKDTPLIDKPDMSKLYKFPLQTKRVNIENINHNLLYYLNSLPERFRSMVVITSGNDSKHETKAFLSKHYTNNAIDLKLGEPGKYSPELSHKDILYQFIKNDPNREIYGIEPPGHPNHGSGPHIHLEMYSNFLGGTKTVEPKLEDTDYSYDEIETEVEEVIVEKVKSGRIIKTLDVKKTLDSIKVNKKVLDFFLKRQQFQ